MNHDENPNDSALTAELRHALSELAYACSSNPVSFEGLEIDDLTWSQQLGDLLGIRRFNRAQLPFEKTNTLVPVVNK